MMKSWGQSAFTLHTLNLFLGFSSVVILAVAYISQYGFGLQPCPLCLWQRWPYMAVAALSLAGIVWRKHPLFLRSLVGVSGVALLVGAVLACYHVGVEQGVFEGPSGCSDTLPTDASLEELHRLIVESPAVRCDEPAIVIAGFSMAGWNAIIGALLGAAAVVSAGKRKFIYWS